MDTISELQLAQLEWPDLLPMVQSVLKNTPTKHRDNVAPITAFTGMQPSPPVAHHQKYGYLS